MLSRTPSRFILALLVLTAGWTATCRAAVSDRIVGSVSASSRVVLAHTVSPKAVRATDLGAAPVSQKLENLSMRFSMTDAQQAALTQLLADQQNPQSPRYRQWLTPQQFGAQFGLSAGDLAKVSSWLTTQGFTVTSVSNSSTFIMFSGTIGQAEQAFGTSIHNVSLNGEQHIANLTDPVLPAVIAGVVTNISGLNDFRLKSRVRPRQVEMSSLNYGVAHPKDTINTTAGLEHFMAPGDFYTIYDETPLLAASPAINGSGVKIAVMGQVDLSTSDVAAFRLASGLPTSTISLQTYGTDPGSPTAACLGTNPPANCFPAAGDLDESQLDVEWSGAVAPSASIIFVNSTNVIDTSLVMAIDNNLAPIMTVSYGDCEANYQPTEIAMLTAAFSQANAQGITVFGPAGDTGATDCDDTGVVTATHGLAVDFPASSPYVTGVGGTEFSEGADQGTPNGTYWNNTVNASTQTTSGLYSGSALSYIPEMVWNDTESEIASTPTTATLSSGGGGKSILFPKPVWQTGTGVPADSARDVPDVSLNASADHDPYLICAESSCAGGTYFNGGSIFAVGGTSVSTPSFAGILALVEQKLNGARLGNVNPYIYSLAGTQYATIFHDVTVGNNSQPCQVGSTGCSTSPIGFSAGVGYDQASGWGSVDTNQFVSNFASATLATTTTTTVTASPLTSTVGQTVTFTATVAASTGTSIPTGSVSFYLPNSTTAVATVALSPTGTATYTTSFSNGGGELVTATYLGTSAFYGSTGAVTETVNVPVVGSAATTTTLSANPATVALGSTITLTATVSSAITGTLAGMVTFSSGTTNLGQAQVVAGSTGNTGTATLPLTASAATLNVGTDLVTAVYGGGGTASTAASYAPSTSSPLSIVVSNPTLTVAASNISISDGASGTTTVTLTSAGGYAGTVGLTATATNSALLSNATVTFTPPSVVLTAGGTGTSTFTIATPAAVGAQIKGGVRMKNSNGLSMLVAGGGISFAGLLLFGLGGSRRRRWPAALFSILALAALGAVMGCGSSSNSVVFPVPTGTYQVTIVGTDSVNSAVTASTTITLTLN